ncbi:MAG: protein-glutamate O-methyltransferase CheR [Planctomycetaceae bacterium]
MNPGDYEYISNFLLTKSGLALGPGKEYLVDARLIPLAQSWGLANIEELVRELRNRKDERLHSAVVEAMTTNETSFFRDKTPFEEMREILLPELIAARKAVRQIRVWCAASSTGQEPYSFLMLMAEHFQSIRDWRIEFVATDIDNTALARAEAALYTQFEVQRGLPIQLLMKYFEQVEKGWRIKDEIRERVSFRQLNLLDDFSRLGQFDIVLCRNVLIYFQNQTKKQILERIAKQLRPDGYLYLGAAETVLGLTTAFERNKQYKSAVYTPAVAAKV